MNRYNIVKYSAFLIEMLLCYIIESTPGLCIPVFGGKPILLIPLALSIAVFEEEIPAIIIGLLSGLLADSGYSGAMGFYAICLSVLCYIASLLMGNYIKTNLLTTLIIGSIAVPLIITLQFLLFYVLMGYGSELEYFLSHYLSRIIYTWVFVPVFYGINRFIAAKTAGSE